MSSSCCTLIPVGTLTRTVLLDVAYVCIHRERVNTEIVGALRISGFFILLKESVRSSLY